MALLWELGELIHGKYFEQGPEGLNILYLLYIGVGSYTEYECVYAYKMPTYIYKYDTVFLVYVCVHFSNKQEAILWINIVMRSFPVSS